MKQIIYHIIIEICMIFVAIELITDESWKNRIGCIEENHDESRIITIIWINYTATALNASYIDIRTLSNRVLG